MPAAKGLTERLLVSSDITAADANSTVKLFEIPAGWLVFEVVLVVTEALSGGTPSLDIGDDDDADGWVDTLDITEATPGAYKGTSANAAYVANPKYYSAKKNLTATVSSGLSAGRAVVLARALDIGGR